MLIAQSQHIIEMLRDKHHQRRGPGIGKIVSGKFFLALDLMLWSSSIVFGCREWRFVRSKT